MGSIKEFFRSDHSDDHSTQHAQNENPTLNVLKDRQRGDKTKESIIEKDGDIRLYDIQMENLEKEHNKSIETLRNLIKKYKKSKLHDAVENLKGYVEKEFENYNKKRNSLAEKRQERVTQLTNNYNLDRKTRLPQKGDSFAEKRLAQPTNNNASYQIAQLRQGYGEKNPYQREVTRLIDQTPPLTRKNHEIEAGRPATPEQKESDVMRWPSSKKEISPSSDKTPQSKEIRDARAGINHALNYDLMLTKESLASVLHSIDKIEYRDDIQQYDRQKEDLKKVYDKKKTVADKLILKNELLGEDKIVDTIKQRLNKAYKKYEHESDSLTKKRQDHINQLKEKYNAEKTTLLVEAAKIKSEIKENNEGVGMPPPRKVDILADMKR